MLDLLLWPFIAGLVLTAIHAYFGLHVLARGVVFVDLSLAQVAAFGVTVALLAGHTVHSDAAYWYALVFALCGAMVFALARPYEAAMQQEAVIGIVYAVSAALGVLVLDRAPQGAEHIKQLLIGSILTVTPEDVGTLAALYAAIGAVHWALRRPLIEVSFEPRRAVANHRRVFLWDVIFYGSFALVVTSSVRIAGVLLVFCYLIVPAAIAGLFAHTVRSRLLIAWIVGATMSAAGLYASWTWDLPTGPAIVAAFGAVTALVAVAFATRRASWRTCAMGGCIAVAVMGLVLVAVPRADQPWLDAVENAVPLVQEAFLTSAEREVRRDSIESVEKAAEELARLRALEQDVRWGAKTMDAERQHRLRQYVASRSEIQAGDRLVLRELQGRARERQRYGLGIPLLLLGAGGLILVTRNAKR
jgi:zinc/manganese transport system permease protein